MPPQRPARRRIRRSFRFLLRWSLITIVVLPLACVTRCAYEFRDVFDVRSSASTIRVESVPTGATIEQGGDADRGPTPARVVLRFDPRSAPAADGDPLTVARDGESSTALLRPVYVVHVGRHSWFKDSGRILAPPADGALWLPRTDETWRVWLPQSGRCRIGVGLYDYHWLAKLAVDGSAIDAWQWGPGSSRRFADCVGLDLAAGEHALAGNHWTAVVQLGERVALAIDEARVDATHEEREARAVRERLRLSIPRDLFPEATIAFDAEPPMPLVRPVGDAPLDFETSRATIALRDRQGREDRVVVTMWKGVGLWIRIGASPRSP